MTSRHQRNPSMNSQTTYLSVNAAETLVNLANKPSPATQMLDQLEAQMSQESCFLDVDAAKKDASTLATQKPQKSMNHFGYSKFESLCEMINVSFPYIELGIEVLEMSIEIKEKTDTREALICENAAIVKDIFKDLDIKPGDVICSHDSSHRVLRYKEFVDLVKMPTRPLKVTLKRFHKFPLKELELSDDEIVEDQSKSNTENISLNNHPTQNNRDDRKKMVVQKDDTNKLAEDVKFEEVHCKTCSNQCYKTRAHHVLCHRSRYFDAGRKELCLQSAKSGCLACVSLFSNGDNCSYIKSHSNACALKKSVVAKRKNAHQKNSLFGILCQVCSDDNHDIIHGLTQHHVHCIDSKKFDANRRDSQCKGVRVGCPACKAIVQYGVSNVHHSNICPLNISLTQNSIDTVETPPKSEYEMLRDKKVERNKLRLSELGLINDKDTTHKKEKENAQSAKKYGSTQAKETNGLTIGCEACLQRFRGEKIKKRHHKQCSLSRRLSQSNVVTRKIVNERKPNELCRKSDKSLSQSISESTSRPVIITPLQNSVFINPSLSSQSASTEKSRWEACGNPWGEFGQGDGDYILLFAYSDSCENDTDVHLRIPDGGIPQRRFIQEPMAPNSPYIKTHCNGNEGGAYNVFMLRRDFAAARPWGFIASLHEFGGACIVNSISPCSPAEAAKDIGGFSISCPTPIENTSITVPVGSYMSPGLHVNDIIVCINGKAVGGMSMNDFSVELETCGAEMILVVARCTNQHEQLQVLTAKSEEERLTWYTIGNGLDWYDLGKNKPSVKNSKPSEDRLESLALKRNIMEVEKVVAKATQPLHSSKQHKSIHPSVGKHTSQQEVIKGQYMESKDVHDIMNKDHSKISLKQDKATTTKCEILKINSSKKLSMKYDNNIEHNYDREETHTLELDPRLDEIEDIDDNVLAYLKEDTPWNGCVCGATHPRPLEVFWIACDTCSAWFNVSPKCIGFDEQTASTLKEWTCWDCAPKPNMSVQLSPQKTSISTHKSLIKETDVVTPSKGIFAHGTVVEVAKRTWSGINKLGGVGKVVGSKVKSDENGLQIVYYDVKYVLGGSECSLEAKYVKPQDQESADGSPAESVGLRCSSKSKS